METTIRLNATKHKDNSFISNEHLDKTHISITDTLENLNIREINIETSEDNDYEDYNNPSCYTTLSCVVITILDTIHTLPPVLNFFAHSPLIPIPPPPLYFLEIG